MIKAKFLQMKQSFYETFFKGNSFAPWGILTLFLNFIMFHGIGFGSDLEYWRKWIESLRLGFGNFTGDYPPVFIIWLRIVSWFYEVSGFSLKLEYELKLFCLIPVVLAHIALVHFIWKRLKKRTWSPEIKKVALILVVANPAFYLDGPIWGQVDLLPATICVFALWYISRPKTYALGMALFVFGLLTKFQMIMFLPVVAGLSLRYRKIMWKGLFSGAFVFLLVFLPFILAGHFVDEFKQAYVSSVESYPYAALNAGNIWMMLVGNMTPDSRPLFENGPAFLNPGLLGKVFFVIVSVLVMAISFFKRNSSGKIMMLGAINALAFFMLLPSMHERYCLAAAVIAVASAVLFPKPKFGTAIAFSAIAFLNISMMTSLRGDSLWFWIAIGGIVAFIVALFNYTFPKKWLKACLAKIPRFQLPGITPYALLLVVISIQAFSSYLSVSRSAYDLKSNEKFVYQLDLLRQHQGYGSTQIGKSIDGNPLHINGNIYIAGLGTHAPSLHEYELPDNAKSFSFMCGIDDESGNGVVNFIVELDGKRIWESGRMEGRQSKSATLDISGGKRLSLITDEMGSKNFDHANWVNPIITME